MPLLLVFLPVAPANADLLETVRRFHPHVRFLRVPPVLPPWLIRRHGIGPKAAPRWNIDGDIDRVVASLQKAFNVAAIKFIPMRLLARLVPIYLHLPVAACDQEQRGSLGHRCERKI